MDSTFDPLPPPYPSNNPTGAFVCTGCGKTFTILIVLDEGRYCHDCYDLIAHPEYKAPHVWVEKCLNDDGLTP